MKRGKHFYTALSIRIISLKIKYWVEHFISSPSSLGKNSNINKISNK